MGGCIVSKEIPNKILGLVWMPGLGFGTQYKFSTVSGVSSEEIRIYLRKLRKKSRQYDYINMNKINCFFFRNNCRGVISDNFPRFNQFKHVIPSGAFCRQRFCQFARRNWILGRIRYGIISRSFQRDHLHNQPVDFNYSCCQQHNFCPGHSWIPGEIMRGYSITWWTYFYWFF